MYGRYNTYGKEPEPSQLALVDLVQARTNEASFTSRHFIFTTVTGRKRRGVIMKACGLRLYFIIRHILGPF